MSESTPETLKRLARAIRDEAKALEDGQRVRDGVVRDARPMDKDYVKGKTDGLRQASDLLDDGSG